MIRAVLDVNVLISAIYFGGVPSSAYQAGLDKQYRLFTSEAICVELARVAAYPKFTDRLEMVGRSVADLIRVYRAIAEVVTEEPVPLDALRDPNDLMFLAAAIGGKANYVVSGDKDLTKKEGGQYKGVQIVTPAQFLAILNTKSSESLLSE